MKRFLPKFLLVCLLFFLPAAYYQYRVIPALSGDLGWLGQIPFGAQYEGLGLDGYERPFLEQALVLQVPEPDSLYAYPYITVGDSFSQQGQNGYQPRLSYLLGAPVANVPCPGSMSPFDLFTALLQADALHPGQTVIIENVERSLLGRLSHIDWQARYSPEPEPAAKPAGKKKATAKEPFLNRYLSWLRLSAGFHNPVTRFRLQKPLFTHPRFASTLHVYNSPSIQDGDLMWSHIPDVWYPEAQEQLDSLISVSQAHGIQMILLIAADKYDSYEPWIQSRHVPNPTLEQMQFPRQVFNSRDCLRKIIGRGALDVYKLNNTHWSALGADMVADTLYAKMKDLGYLPL